MADTRPMPGESKFLPGTRIEIVYEFSSAAKPRHALFDFDGTLSLIREGWIEVMVPMMVEALQATGTSETPEELGLLVREFVMELTGKQTIYQMMRLADEVARRGATPEDPLEYKSRYHEQLMRRIHDRREALRAGRDSPQRWLVAGAQQILGELQARGVELYLASGTDEHFVREEAALLQIGDFFGERIYGAVDDYRNFSKQMVIDRILNENEVDGETLIGFGDGYVEIDNVRSVGGVAVGVASDEEARNGQIDEWKRQRLIGVGAQIVVPDFGECDTMCQYLFREM